MGTLVHTGLGSSYIIAHVAHYPLANSFTIGTAEINNNNLEKVVLNFHFLVKLVLFVNLKGSWFRYDDRPFIVLAETKPSCLGPLLS